MKLTIDQAAGMSYLYLTDPAPVSRTEEFDGFNIDFGPDGKPTGIEIFGTPEIDKELKEKK